jgi:hypothetical protein
MEAKKKKTWNLPFPSQKPETSEACIEKKKEYVNKLITNEEK